MKLNKEGWDLLYKWSGIYAEENDRLGGNSSEGIFVEGWSIVDNFNFIKDISDECGVLIFGYTEDAIFKVEEFIELYGDSEVGKLGFKHSDVLKELEKYFEKEDENNTMYAKILLPKEELEHLTNLTTMTTKEIFEKYGYEKEKVFSHCISFENGVIAKISLTIMPEDDWIPITDITIYKDNKELSHNTSVDSHYEGKWWIEYEGIEYFVNVTSK